MKDIVSCATNQGGAEDMLPTATVRGTRNGNEILFRVPRTKVEGKINQIKKTSPSPYQKMICRFYRA